MERLEVVAGIINNGKEIFCAQRNEDGLLPLKWEFPGGKIEEGEAHEETLIRELKEELDVDARVGGYFMTVEHQYDDFFLTMHLYHCVLKKDAVITLKEHKDSLWLPVMGLPSLDWADADWPIIEKLIDQYMTGI